MKHGNWVRFWLSLFILGALVALPAKLISGEFPPWYNVLVFIVGFPTILTAAVRVFGDRNGH